MHTVLDCSLRGHWVYWEAGKQAAARHQWVGASFYMPDVIKHIGIHECIFCLHDAYVLTVSLLTSVCLAGPGLFVITLLAMCPHPGRPAPGQDGVRFRVGSLYESVGYPA